MGNHSAKLNYGACFTVSCWDAVLSPHRGISFCAGSGLGSDSGAGPTVTAGGLGQSSGAKASSMAAQDSPSSFYHTTGPSHPPPADNMAHVQSARGTATGAGFDSTYRSTEPVSHHSFPPTCCFARLIQL